MSISFRQFRKTSTAQGRFKDLVRDYQRFVSEQVTVDNPDFRVKSRTMYSKLAYRDPFITHNTKPLTTQFYLTFEPDAWNVTGMWNLDHNGRFCVDASGAHHVGRFIENAGIREGIDLGFGTSLYARFNNKIFVYVDNSGDLMLSLSNSFTITVRIYPEVIEASDGPSGTKYRTILHKPDRSDSSGTHAGEIDGGTVSYGYHLAVTTDGKVRFTIANNGILYSVETLGNVIVANSPVPFAYDIVVTCDQVNRRPILPQFMDDPGNVIGSDPDAEPLYQPGTTAPRMEIAVNNQFYALQTLEHLSFVDDPMLRLRFGATWNFRDINNPESWTWYKWVGGLQQIRFYKNRLLTAAEIRNLYLNKLTVADMPFGSPALAGSVLMIDPDWIGSYDLGGFDEEGFLTGIIDSGTEGFPGFDPNGFDSTGYDTLILSDQGTIQGGGYDPRGFSDIGFDTIPFSQS